MSKVKSRRSGHRYNPLDTTPPETLTPGRTLQFIFYDPHAEAKKRESHLAYPRRGRHLMGAIGDQPEPLHGIKWLHHQTQEFQEDFWQQFVPPAGIKARGNNPWSAFKAWATTILQEHDWDNFITASEVWKIIRADRRDIVESWQAVVNTIEDSSLPYAPLKRKRGKRLNYQGVMQTQMPIASTSGTLYNSLDYNHMFVCIWPQF
jgi:hypothetical protein